MIFHENRLLADDSHELSYLIFSKLGKMSQNLSSTAVVIGALRVNGKNTLPMGCILFLFIVVPLKTWIHLRKTKPFKSYQHKCPFIVYCVIYFENVFRSLSIFTFNSAK